MLLKIQAGYIRKAGRENSSTERWLIAGRDLILVFLLETEAFLCLQRLMDLAGLSFNDEQIDI